MKTKKYNFFLDGKKYNSGLYPDNDDKLIEEIKNLFRTKNKLVEITGIRYNKNSTTLYLKTTGIYIFK